MGKGKLGKDLTVEQGREAARQAGLIMLTKIRARQPRGFGDQPLVVNGFPISWWKCSVKPEDMRAPPLVWLAFLATRRSRWK